ncbi:MAG: iron-containing alcohol dehydrogenase [Alphaproteobacteria bacterium]|nr:iron-containing alcohol dehydrogenase [Alphaproteobacteria bacterium]
MNIQRPITLHQPARLEIGAGTVSRAGIWAKNKRTLVLTTAPVLMHVERLNIKGELQVFSNIPPEPDDIALAQVLEVAKSFEPEVIIGLGGGSVMDMAKLAAVLWDGKQKLANVIGPNKINKKLSQIIQIPTTAGTGSEAGIRALVTNSATNAKMAIESPLMLADLAILDPELTFSVPASVTATTGVDAMAHCVEAFTNINAHELIDDYARMGINLVGKYLKRAVDDGNDTQAREGMMLASYYGGVCLGPVNTAAGHALAYPLGTQLKLPHGLANAIVFPHVLAFNTSSCKQKTAEILNSLNLPISLRTEDVLKSTYDFASSLGIKMKLSQHGATSEQLQKYAEEAHGIRRLMDNNPRDMSLEDVFEIYKATL